jgi:hypothetical protein
MLNTPTTVAELRAAADAGKAEARRVWQREFGIDLAAPGARGIIAGAVRRAIPGSANAADAASRLGTALRAGGVSC